jgi:hypothetical protein
VEAAVPFAGGTPGLPGPAGSEPLGEATGVDEFDVGSVPTVVAAEPGLSSDEQPAKDAAAIPRAASAPARLLLLLMVVLSPRFGPRDHRSVGPRCPPGTSHPKR